MTIPVKITLGQKIHHCRILRNNQKWKMKRICNQPVETGHYEVLKHHQSALHYDFPCQMRIPANN